MTKILIICVLLMFGHQAHSQGPAYPTVGQPCPKLELNEIAYDSNTHATLETFKGKWLILDFWNRYCSVCLNRMPGTDSLQKKFKGQLKVMMVGYTGSQYTHRSDEDKIKSLYRRFRKESHLDLPIAYDSVMFHRFSIGACPYVIIVDPKGVVRAVTTEINAFQFQELMAGRDPHLTKATNRKGK